MAFWSRREFVAGALALPWAGRLAEDILSPKGGVSVDRFGMFGKVTAQPGKRDELVQHLLTAAKLVGDAPGCELYVVYVSVTEPNDIWVAEAWRSKSDHDASLSLTAVKELIAKARPLIAAFDSIQATPVGGFGLADR